ncbi:unnamed protein product [Toxocara canis]|uniref:Uncharacterized protein n=1 Tax=Toxocara canis TaxID=6265 RepID=A0A183UPK6_TOXCA|nr:unnamed protein product [Toxocara canis]
MWHSKRPECEGGAVGGDDKAEREPLWTNVMSTSQPLNVACSAGTSSKDLVDLEALVLNWAKQIFEVTKTKAEARISKKYLQILNEKHIVQNVC